MNEVMDNKTPLISIVVPVYHVAAYIHRCVDSILNQSYRNLEVILVDDGGDDVCPAICDEYALFDNRVICVHKENSGQSFARKAGVESAAGEYILFVDADDWLETNAVEKSLRAAVEFDADVVCFGYKRVYEKNTFLTSVFPQVEEKQAWLHGQIPELQRRIVGLVGKELAYVESADRMAPMWGKLYRANVVAAGKWVSERETGSSEDAIFNLYALSACKKFVYINDYLYCYRKTNEQATTRRYRKNMVGQWERLFEYFSEFCEQNGCSQRYTGALANRICLSIIGIGLNELSNPKGFFEKAKNLRQVLNKPLWKKAYAQLDFRYLPLKWKVFFSLCRLKCTEILLIILFLIEYLKKRISE